MHSLTLQKPAKLMFQTVSIRFRLWPRFLHRAPSSPETDRNRRDFVNDMLSRNPTAFSSAEDVQSAMLCFPDRF